MKNILLVDDCPDFRFLIKELLHENALIYEASSGQEALLLIGQRKIDIVISDFEMNNGNGLWLLKELKLINQRPKVIILSGTVGLDKKTLEEAGAVAIFSKSSQLNMLVNYISLL
jgi:CheY-like chemotaxis protein